MLFEMLAGKRPYSAGTIEEAMGFLSSQDPIPDVRTFASGAFAGGGFTPCDPKAKTQASVKTQVSTPAPSGEAAQAAGGRQAAMPDAVVELLRQMCERNVPQRLTADQVVAKIDQILSEGNVAQKSEESKPAPEPSKPDDVVLPRPWESPVDAKRRLMRVVCVVMLLVVAGIAALAALRQRSATQPRKSVPPSKPVSPSKLDPKPDVEPPKPVQPPKPEVEPPKPSEPSPKPKEVVTFAPSEGKLEVMLARLNRQIDAKPTRLKVSLSRWAYARDLSPERYEQILVSAVERLRNSEVKFSLVCGGGKYGAVARDVAKRYGCDAE